MGKRALGINSAMLAAFEDPNSYGTVPGANWLKIPFVTSDLGEEQPLEEDDQLGFGREGLDPDYDVRTNAGDVTVPLDTRASGFWFKLLLGAPTSTVKDAAKGFLNVTAQPPANKTITIGGQVFTFVAAAPAANQILIGADVAATATAIAAALNASVVAGVAVATYAAAGSKVNITYDTAGLAGNAMALAAQAGSNIVTSGDTLSGGTMSHVFTSGADAVPSSSIEVGTPDISQFSVNFGGRANTLKFTQTKSGKLNMTISMICKGETPNAQASVEEDPEILRGPRFIQASGFIKRAGVTLGGIVSHDFAYTNNLETVDTIQADGRIEDADLGSARATGSLVTKYQDSSYKDQAETQEPVEISFGFVKDAANLTIDLARIFLPKVKNGISGPKGIQATYPYQASGAEGPQMTLTLVNDVEAY